jgi:hypothetical protein
VDHDRTLLWCADTRYPETGTSGSQAASPRRRVVIRIVLSSTCADFLGAIPKKKPASSAAAAKAAGGPKPAPPPKTKPEVRGDKRQRNSSGASANTPKKQKEEGQGFDPRAQATALGGRHRIPPSPTTSISTVTSEVTDTGTIEDQEVGDELAGIKQCIANMQMDSVPATKVCNFVLPL